MQAEAKYASVAPTDESKLKSYCWGCCYLTRNLSQIQAQTHWNILVHMKSLLEDRGDYSSRWLHVMPIFHRPVFVACKTLHTVLSLQTGWQKKLYSFNFACFIPNQPQSNTSTINGHHDFIQPLALTFIGYYFLSHFLCKAYWRKRHTELGKRKKDTAEDDGRRGNAL